MHPWISIRGCVLRSMSLSVGPSIASADGVTATVMTPPSPSLLPLTTRSGHEIAAVAFFSRVLRDSISRYVGWLVGWLVRPSVGQQQVSKL